MRYFIDCEFDGHNGPLLSISMICEYKSMHIVTTNEAHDPWVIANVVPHMHSHKADIALVNVPENAVGRNLKDFIDDDTCPVILADSPVDIARFCAAISTESNGKWSSCDYPYMAFEVHNVESYPTKLDGAVQHNAWWDAKALRNSLWHIEGQV